MKIKSISSVILAVFLSISVNAQVLTIEISGIRNSKGNIAVAVFTDNTSFNKEETYFEEMYPKTSLLNKAAELKGRLLMIHGYQDPVVVPQNSIDFMKSCIKEGTDVDFFLYPESEHNMRGKARVHLMKKVTRYFDDYL